MENEQPSLLDVLDKLLEKGAVVKGDVLLTVADIDLVYLNLELLLSAISTVKKGISQGGGNEKAINLAVEGYPENAGSKKKHADEVASFATDDKDEKTPGSKTEMKPTKIAVDEKNAAKGLAKLVLVLVDLLRKLMERQAVRRMEQGQLTSEETERAGKAFLLLDRKIEQLKKVFDLKNEDLNFDLGPLGRVI